MWINIEISKEGFVLRSLKTLSRKNQTVSEIKISLNFRLKVKSRSENRGVVTEILERPLYGSKSFCKSTTLWFFAKVRKWTLLLRGRRSFLSDEDFKYHLGQLNLINDWVLKKDPLHPEIITFLKNWIGVGMCYINYSSDCKVMTKSFWTWVEETPS